MTLDLIRIDDRLVHGQVTIGWGNLIKPDRILLVSDEIAEDEWQKDLFTSCCPFNISISIMDVQNAADALLKGEFENSKVILLTETPSVVVDLMKKGLSFKKVNIGGMHFKPDKKKLLSFVYVDDEDIKAFQYLKEHNVELSCQELPQVKKQDLSDLLKNI